MKNNENNHEAVDGIDDHDAESFEHADEPLSSDRNTYVKAMLLRFMQTTKRMRDRRERRKNRKSWKNENYDD